MSSYRPTPLTAKATAPSRPESHVGARTGLGQGSQGMTQQALQHEVEVGEQMGFPSAFPTAVGSSRLRCRHPAGEGKPGMMTFSQLGEQAGH